MGDGNEADFVLPHNDEAEQSVLGAIINNNAIYDEVVEQAHLDEHCFFRKEHRLIWNAITSLLIAKKPVDTVTLLDALGSVLDEAGGIEVVGGLSVHHWSTEIALDHAHIIRQKSFRRRVVDSSLKIANLACKGPLPYTPDYDEELLAICEDEFAQLEGLLVHQPEPSKSVILKEVLYKLEHRVDDGIPTGFEGLDEHFGGFTTGQLSILAARTSKGKSTVALSWALHAARVGHSVAFFTLEQPVDEVYTRLLGMAGNVDTTFHARRYGLLQEETKRLVVARDELAQIPITLRYRPGLRPRQLKIDCKRLAREQGPLKLVVVDYFNLMKDDQRHHERWQMMHDVIIALKDIAGELGVPMLVLAQLNRDVEERLPPQLSNLRDTGAAEEHASNVLLIWQPPQPPRSPVGPVVVSDPHSVAIELIIAKQRNGPAGMRIPLRFNRQYGTFERGYGLYDIPNRRTTNDAFRPTFSS